MLRAVCAAFHAYDVDETAIELGLRALQHVIVLQGALERLHPCPFGRAVQLHHDCSAAAVQGHALHAQCAG